MPNPLGVLGSIAGGLSTVGAGGAGGAYEGAVEGEVLKRKFQSEDMQNSLRALEAILRGQQIQQFGRPTYQFHGDRMFTIPPTGPPQVTELQPTAGGQARIDLLGQQATLANQRADLAEQRRLLLEQKGEKKSPFETYLDLLRSGDKAAAADYIQRYQEIKAAEHPQRPALPSTSERTLLTWLAAKGLPDTAQNREAARQALLKEREQSQVRVATDVARLQADVARKAGGEATKELGKIQHQAGLLDQAEDMADSMEAEIRKLAKFSSQSTTFNFLRQQVAARGGVGPRAKEIADALAAVQASNARYASIAQGVEGVTGNRLALQLADRMRAMHVHEEEPLSRNLERLRVLRATIKQLRTQINAHTQNLIRRQQETMESVGRPGTPLSAYQGAAGRAPAEDDEVVDFESLPK